MIRLHKLADKLVLAILTAVHELLQRCSTDEELEMLWKEIENL